MRQYFGGMNCVLDLFWGLLSIHLLKSSKNIDFFILSDLFVDKLNLRRIIDKWFDYGHCCNKK